MCGFTPHFTSFAILLGGSEGGGQNSSESGGHVLGWLALAFVLASIITVGVVVGISELRHQRKKINRRMEDKQIATRMLQLQRDSATYNS
jgi:hypothetical protein